MYFDLTLICTYNCPTIQRLFSHDVTRILSDKVGGESRISPCTEGKTSRRTLSYPLHSPVRNLPCTYAKTGPTGRRRDECAKQWNELVVMQDMELDEVPDSLENEQQFWTGKSFNT